MIRAVIFDLDDTLFDDTACTQAGLAALTRIHNITQITPEQLFRRHAEIITSLEPMLFSGEVDVHGARVLRFQRLLTELGVSDPDGEAATHQYISAYRHAWRLCDGAEGVLEGLNARGLKIAILTNYARTVQVEKLNHFGLMPHVAALLCVEDVPAPKPDPRAYLTACQRLDVRPDETLMVGDSWANDVQGAQNAGLSAIWINRNGGEDQRDSVPIIARLNELRSLLI